MYVKAREGPATGDGYRRNMPIRDLSSINDDRTTSNGFDLNVSQNDRIAY